MKIPNYLLIGIIVTAASTGVVFADTLTELTVTGQSVFQDKATFNGPMKMVGQQMFVQDGGLDFKRTDGQNQFFVMRTSNGYSTFKLSDVDNSNNALMRLTPAGDKYEVVLVPSGQSPKYLLVGDTNGNVGIGTATPTETLDVKGDVKLSGSNSKIYSNGDICIGSCD